MVPKLPKEGWYELLEVVEIDATISAEVETSGVARNEPQFYEPFGIIANRITDLFMEHCSVERKTKIFDPSSSNIHGPPSYDHGEPVAGTEYKGKPDGLVLLAEGLEEGGCFKQHEQTKRGVQHLEGRDLSDGYRKSILAVEHKLISKVDGMLYATCQSRMAVNPRASFFTTTSSSIFTSSSNATSSANVTPSRNATSTSNITLFKSMPDPRMQGKHRHQTRLRAMLSLSVPVQAASSQGLVPSLHASDRSNKRAHGDANESECEGEDENDKPQPDGPNKKRWQKEQTKEVVSDPALIQPTVDDLQRASHAMGMMYVLDNREHAFSILDPF
ncbi:hypothetical protein FRB97_005490 [Tulasnella sp. 331]|nr:hypothetical protein FRB97_005490 [Tulasnella sp. 331]